MGTSLRSWLHPAGDGGVAGVRQGNFLAVRSWLYTIFARALGAATILEQPAHRAGTAMGRQPFFQKCIREFHTVRLEVRQDCWGAETRKPTWLYVSHAVPWAWMCEQKPENMDISFDEPHPHITHQSFGACMVACLFISQLRVSGC